MLIIIGKLLVLTLESIQLRSTTLQHRARRSRVIHANVLLYIFRRDAEHHDDYRSWLERVVNGEAAYGISPQVLASVIRIGTHRRIYVHPNTTPEALAYCEAMLQPPTAASSSPAPATGHLHRPLS